jgi:8-oxo-dGTP pyrophosphatase MutT (NUDIX family)
MARQRQAARVVLLDQDDRVLLLSARDPFDPAKGEWWELPGGGMEPGELSGRAAARELHEETGISEFEMGPCVWRHHARFTFAGIRFDQEEHIHVARCAGFDSDYRPPGLEAFEALAFQGYRWWTVAELVGMRIIPSWLAERLPLFITEGPPAEPVHLGDLGPLV